MPSERLATSSPPRTERGRAAVTVIVAAIAGTALAFVVQGRHRGVGVATPPESTAPVSAPVAWEADRCPAWIAPPPSPLDAIARASASFAPAPDALLLGLAVGERSGAAGERGGVLAVWTSRR